MTQSKQLYDFHAGWIEQVWQTLNWEILPVPPFHAGWIAQVWPIAEP